MIDGGRPRILVVEDEWLIADLVEAMLTELGYEVVGPASNVGQALSLLEDEAPDAALLDVSLGDDRSFAVADAMRRRGAPFLFLTGYAPADLPEAYRTAGLLRKPITIAELEAPLAQMAERACGGVDARAGA